MSPRGSPARRVAAAADLSARIAAIRRARGLSQAAFARQIGVSRNVVVRYERGVIRPRAITLAAIARAGGVSVDWLLRGRAPRQAGERGWTEAVALLRAAWRDPRRRRMVRGFLRALWAAGPAP